MRILRKMMVFALTGLTLVSASADAFALGSVTLLADNNLGIAITRLARDYAAQKNVIVNSSFAPSDAQNMQINEGAAADILITSKESWIDELKTKGLLDISSQISVVRDQLALVGPADSVIDVKLVNRFPVAEIISAIGDDPLFVLPSPETLPEGGFAKEAMRNIGAAYYLEPVTVYLKQRQDMLEMVKNNHAYGVFLNSSVQNNENIKLLDVFPESQHRPIHYYAVVIASDNMENARKFIEYLQSGRAKKIFRDQGFLAD